MEPTPTQAADQAQIFDIISNVPPEVLDMMAQYLPNESVAALRSVNHRANQGAEDEFQNREDLESWRQWMQGIIDRVNAVFAQADTAVSPAEFEEIIETLEQYNARAGDIPPTPELRTLNDEVTHLVLQIQQTMTGPAGNMLSPEWRARGAALM